MSHLGNTQKKLEVRGYFISDSKMVLLDTNFMDLESYLQFEDLGV